MKPSLANQGNKHNRPQKSVPGFNEVGTPVTSEEVNVTETVEAAENTETVETNETAATPEVKTEDKPEVKTATSVDEIIATVTDKQKPIEKEPITIFIDSDIKKKFVAFGKKHGKGSRSELINTFLRSIFDKE